jgi:anti-sigma factor RsiW
MKCKQLHNKLIFYLEGDLPKDEMDFVKKHLSECPDCAAFADEMRKTFAVLEAEKSPEVNPFFYTRLKAKMEAQAEAVEPATANPYWRRILQPALFSLLLLIGIYSGIKIGQKAEDQLFAASSADEQIIPYLNEMEVEPIETFLME